LTQGISNRDIGNIGEEKAKLFLIKVGFEIIKSNYHSRYGEIDIIAKKNEVLHFIEVKYSRGNFEPIYNITNKKLQKIIKTVDVYIRDFDNIDFCIDAIIIKGDDISLLENITI
jgi:putative endonuclease